MELGFEVVKTKDRPFWHREDGSYAGIPISIGDDDDDGEDKDKPTDKKTQYPVFAIDDAPKELYDYPEEGTCTITYKIKRRSMVDPEEGDPRYSVELAIMSIEPKDMPKSGRKSASERTRESSEAYGRAMSRAK